MANETLYPFGGGQLPSGFPVVDDCNTDRGDVSLSARQGKLLQEQINQFNLGETQTYGKLVPMNTYSGKTVGMDGTIADSSYPSSFVNEFPIDLVNSDYLGSYGFGSTQIATYTLNYYDEEWNYLGGAVINPGEEPLTNYTLTRLSYPASWTGDEETYKAQAKFLRITGFTGSREANLYETWTIPQSILAQPATPNEIYIFASLIQSPALYDGANSNTEIETADVVSPWGIVFPDTYTVTGNPTPIVAMLHGSEGYVAEGVLGYTTTNWVNLRNQFLAAGFAVMDINGYGVSSEPDDKSKHWGCPLAIETLDKAFEFLKKNFNVCDKLQILGMSMGGTLAESYTKCFPGKVSCVGLFAPNFFAYSCRFIEDSSKYLAWGYADHAEADADNYGHLTGYIPLNECMVVDGDTDAIKKFDWTDYDADTTAQILSKKLIDFFPVAVRVWQGSADTSVPLSNSQLLVSSFRRGNSPATLRICNGATHSIASNAYVRNEAVSWFKRFISTQTITE